MKLFVKIAFVALMGFAVYAPLSPLAAPLRIEITEGVIEPMPIAAPKFVGRGNGAGRYANEITQVIMDDLTGSGLFREIPASAHISGIDNFDAPIQFSDWKSINAQALITGAVALNGDQITVKFRLFDVFAQSDLGEGLQFVATKGSWRRMAHKVADAVYARLTGETGYFDSRVVYISEEGPKNARQKRLAIMDYDGANNRFLTDANSIVLAPRFSPNAKEIVYTSYETGMPKVFLMNVDTLKRRSLDEQPGMTFAPRFSPDGSRVILSLTERGNTDIYIIELATGQKTRLTSGASIETAPSFSPDGSQIVFESDRGGKQQIYVMPATGGTPKRISFGKGSYGTPVWSPRGDSIAFTKISGGRFHIGVMRTDGSNERLLTASFLDEGPTWSPNGRVIMFFRETAGARGAPSLYSVDITGRNLKQVKTPNFGSDPAWSRLLK
ncbi:protein TolB [Amylibacter marinus]|uniref:Tol-Pal system protein TolB n=1 Tax=Amylibacter marinus TaxID=1475483 RepID=A0ABQ5VQV7_9RHOB|nr:Tol-Pal system beta propeller repeat protein TolB [Amylibacter marinus]GLQ33781.1 protein TolB [Amylibacter marinus]